MTNGRGQNQTRWQVIGNEMTVSRQVAMTMVRAFLMSRISTIMHPQKIAERERCIQLFMLLIMLYQIPQMGRLINPDTRQ